MAQLPPDSPPLPPTFGQPIEVGEFPLEPGLKGIWAQCPGYVVLSYLVGNTPLALDQVLQHETRGEETDTRILSRQDGLFWVEDRRSLNAWLRMPPGRRWSDGTVYWTQTYGDHIAGGGVSIYFRIELILRPELGRASWIHTHVVCLP